MIMSWLPDRCPRCSAALSEDRGETDAIARATLGMDQPFFYAVYVCTSGHTVQIGTPPPLMNPPQTRPMVVPTCPCCGKRFVGRQGNQKYCGATCASRMARTKSRAPTQNAADNKGRAW